VDDQVATLASASAAAFAGAMAADVWGGVRGAVAWLFRRLLPRRADAARTRPTSSTPPSQVGTRVQTSIARDHGTVFAVQDGSQYVHSHSQPTGLQGPFPKGRWANAE
jgi:hypothetical protein